ncbi:hypothetical protein Y927_23700 [Salmonella enterica subsp. enterica serovar Tennessee]|nr:hypothetical protein Y927_23700 [Salmonella enterica subsp. enterica serovar Tennessee]
MAVGAALNGAVFLICARHTQQGQFAAFFDIVANSGIASRHSITDAKSLMICAVNDVQATGKLSSLRKFTITVDSGCCTWQQCCGSEAGFGLVELSLKNNPQPTRQAENSDPPFLLEKKKKTERRKPPTLLL